MATRLYLHRNASPMGGTLPATTATVSATAPTWTPGQTNSVITTPLLTNFRMDPVISQTAETSIAYTTDNVTTAQRQPLIRFISPALAAQTILGTQSIIVHHGANCSSTVSVFWTYFTLAIWRPGTGAVVGRIYDQKAASGGATSTNHGSFSVPNTSGTTQTAQAGDILILEIWRGPELQTMATSYTNTFFYDGRTHQSTTDIASSLEFANDLTFVRPSTADAYGTAIMAETSLRHYWRLGETAPPFLDADGYTDLGIAAGSNFQYNQPTLPALGNSGVRNTASPNTTRISGVSPDIDSAGPFSIECWFYTTAVPASTGIIVGCSQTSSAIFGWSLGLTNGTQVIDARAGNGTSIYGPTGGDRSFQLNTWYHLVLTYDGTNLRFYMNGQIIGSPSAAFTMAAASTNEDIGITGGNNVTNVAANATVDEVAWYNAALSAGAILAHYQLVVPPRLTPTLVGPVDAFANSVID